MRHLFIYFNVLAITGVVVGQYLYPPTAWAWLFVAPILILGWYDMLQKNHTILRNFPVLGHFRFLFELIRPEIYQYFVESDTDGVPFDRDTRSLVYQRAKDVRDTVPFGTKENVYEVGYEWVNHSMAPVHNAPEDMRVTIGGPDCTQPYSASLLNISAMSYGALSKNAILALSAGAKQGNFAHNTGE
ncbi:MAG TPA: FMN-binding glutamate synthase family protein, partial [Rhodopirellula sp.]|nr:FMN-binding glutamate synthase family protein [Rhodopirellula sp.]